MERLRQLGEQERQDGSALLLTRIRGEVEDQLRASGTLASIDGMFPTVEAVMEQAGRMRSAPGERGTESR